MLTALYNDNWLPLANSNAEHFEQDLEPNRQKYIFSDKDKSVFNNQIFALESSEVSKLKRLGLPNDEHQRLAATDQTVHVGHDPMLFQIQTVFMAKIAWHNPINFSTF